ncbi:hypothetical protein AG1IA_01246 [Rhizoctonia solani AG-1 IA]|uniref:Uncharacterized protein n=1 Tax=Thanatephorus cucumeris (strain AG1-IA) TaxID=983506 RepID=L8X350_THACA|nr:hypothetical protein AG1IA_01246 [Rhizoctonia solani AG-1 IA]
MSIHNGKQLAILLYNRWGSAAGSRGDEVAEQFKRLTGAVGAPEVDVGKPLAMFV